MRQRFTGIAAVLILVMMMPVSRACAMMSQGAKVQQDCCQHKTPADSCCDSAMRLGCAARVPGDTTQYPVQAASPLVLPSATVAVVYHDSLGRLKSRCAALYLPASHAPPGLLVAATTILRI